MTTEGVGKDIREQRCDHTVGEGRTDPDRNQRPHIRAAIDDGVPTALKEGKCGPKDDGRSQREFEPGCETFADPVANWQTEHRPHG